MTREAALAAARARFTAGDRLDMRSLAEQLGVGRTTLYRWFGDREALLGEILAGMSRRTFQQATATTPGVGAERAFTVLRDFMQTTADYPPLRAFAQREPGPALRVLMADDGAVTGALREGFGAVFADSRMPWVGPQLVEVMVQLATALQWAPIVIGEDASIDRAITLMKGLAHPPQAG